MRFRRHRREEGGGVFLSRRHLHEATSQASCLFLLLFSKPCLSSILLRADDADALLLFPRTAMLPALSPAVTAKGPDRRFYFSSSCRNHHEQRGGSALFPRAAIGTSCSQGSAVSAVAYRGCCYPFQHCYRRLQLLWPSSPSHAAALPPAGAAPGDRHSHPPSRRHPRVQGPGAGNYAKKANVCGEARAEGKVASHLPYLGVRTRAQTLALNLQESTPEATSSYLQLRNRRIEKHSYSPSSAWSRAVPKSRLNVCPGPSPSRQIGGNKVVAKRGQLSFGCRSDIETTPCSLIRNSEAIETRCSTTRSTYSTANRRQQLPITSSIPSASEVEMERLFAGPQQLQQRRFVEYTFLYALNFLHDSTSLDS
ncbi:hypothetical protein ZIOFF_024561 [Zingiber officinale]|uniref:Uncharacterized protein n=1 Tax=Zingiber officinale TaxID=94328 RepID=A0A8J5LDM0_ZINOF|nr:hypothetical protein ZIOFF_024561 [Zingiber officinale]